MPERHMRFRWAKAVAMGSVVLACAAGTTAAHAATAASAAGTSSSAILPHICRSANGHEKLAISLSSRVQRVLSRHPRSRVSLRVDDPYLGLECWLAGRRHHDSASTVKATILAALLRKAQQQHRSLTTAEKREAWVMITLSDNNAATYLWNDVGMRWLQRFLNLAGMRHTYLGRDGYWGLTQITAYDEILLLRLLEHPNSVLTGASRRYELRLMAHVVSYERWGTPTGVPAGYVVHVKNGWLPVPPYQRWVINSLGAFTRPGRDCNIVALTDNNPTEDYGIATINDVALVINRMLNPGTQSAVPPSYPLHPGVPDEHIPGSAFAAK